MTKSKHHDYSARFLEIFDELIKKGTVGNMKDFCQRIDYLPQNMSQVRSGKRDVTIELIVRLFYEFGGNPVFVLLGLGEKILDKDHVPTVPKNSLSLVNESDAKLIKRLEELVESKSENIALLKKEVERLTIQLGSKKT